MLSVALMIVAGCSPQDTTLTNGGDTQEVVTGTGKMEVDPEEVFIENIQVGYSKSAPFTVTSVGDGNLQIYEVKKVADATQAFYFDTITNIELAPGQSVTYTVVADLPDTNPADGELRLRTNDPDASSFILPIHGWPDGYVPPADTGGDSGGTP